MSHRWIITEEEFPRRCGVPTDAHAKEFSTPESFFRELYYHGLVHGQTWHQGYVPLIGQCWSGPRRVIFYTGTRLPEDFELSHQSVVDLVYSVYMLALTDCYLVNLRRESLFWDTFAQQVRLADYQLFDPAHYDTYDYDSETDHWVRQTYQQGLLASQSPPPTTPELREQLLNATLRTLESALEVDLSLMWRELATVTKPRFRIPPMNPPQFIRAMLELVKERFEGLNVIQPGLDSEEPNADAAVVTPPLPCNDEPGPTYPFVGKVIRHLPSASHEYEVSLEFDRLDSAGRFHARLIRACPVSEMPGLQLIYEYAGDPLARMIHQLNHRSRIYLYLGLLDLLDGLHRLHQHGLIHGDIKHENVVVDRFFHPRLIDYGLARKASEHTINTEVEEWTYAAHPPELKLIDDPSVSAQVLLDSLTESQSIHVTPIQEQYRQVVGLVSVEDYQRYRQALLDRLLCDWLAGVSFIATQADLYGLGISLLFGIPTEFRTELQPVLYHLLAVSATERSYELARRELVALVERVDEADSPVLPFYH